MAAKRGNRNSFYNRVDSIPVRYKYILVGFFVLVIFVNAFLMFFGESRESHKATGFGTTTTASAIFSIIGNPIIQIISPENITYNFSIGQPYILNLSVIANIPISAWSFSLYDLKHGLPVYQDVAFSPNTTFTAVRWSNLLIVNALTSDSRYDDANVTFYVNVPNSAPVLGAIVNPIYVCENSALNYLFNATDVDEDDNIENPLITDVIDFSGTFFSRFLNRILIDNNFSVDSGRLDKGDVGTVNSGFRNYPVNISVSDGERSDTKETNVVLIEINNPPWIENITVQTIPTPLWNRGVNSTFYKNFSFGDIEYSNWSYGVLNLNVTIFNSTGSLVNLFNVSRNGTIGFINFTATNRTIPGVYDVYVCVNDTGLTNRHPLIQSQCGQDGLTKMTCEYFELTITDRNRPPTIVDFNPDNNNTLSVVGNQNIYFNITKYDPDGTTPDSYWYVDKVLVAYFEGNMTDEFNYNFACDVFGQHNIRAVITDGELNDSVDWNFSVSAVSCTQPGGSSRGGGGGSVTPLCNPIWGCTSWNVCQNADSSLTTGLLSREDYRAISEKCQEDALTSDRCGFQIRACPDLNSCNMKYSKPYEVQSCLYTPNPRCDDGIKNCHNGDCELLVDCGGPCDTCPSCSDKEKNQGEEGVDCGGPCPWQCEPAVPLLKRKNIIYGFLLLILLILIFIIIKLIRILRYRKIIESTKRPSV
jgi:hypothetical protein